MIWIGGFGGLGDWGMGVHGFEVWGSGKLFDCGIRKKDNF